MGLLGPAYFGGRPPAAFFTRGSAWTGEEVCVPPDRAEAGWASREEEDFMMQEELELRNKGDASGEMELVIAFSPRD